MEVYVDDMLVKSRAACNHVADLEEAFQVLREHNMKLHPTKCTFGVGAGKFLGFMCQAAFEELKQYLSSPPLLSKPEPGEELILYLSAGHLAVAAVLIREEYHQQKPIYYVSKVLHDAETRYQRVEKLVYALVMAARKLRPYFQAHTIKVLTGQPLRQILHRPDTSGRLVKWAVELSEFDIKYLPRPAIKAQVLADFIAECTMPDSNPGSEAALPTAAEPTISEQQVEAEAVPLTGPEDAPPPTSPLPCSEEPFWEVYVDGSSNKGGSGAGLILTGPDDFVLNYALRFGFRASNNEIQGVYEAREERMIKYLQRVRVLAGKFESFELIRVPRAENTKADVLSKLAVSGYTALKEIRMEFLKTSSIDDQPVVVMQIDDEPCWMDEIIRYLRSGELPGEKKEARKVVQRAARFSFDGETLYKRSYTLPYLKCLRPTDALYALRETHEGICGEHLGGKALAIKVLLRGLYWPTLRRDALSLVKKCEKCQKFSPTVHQPAVPMAPIISPLPFAIWGMDILGPFPPSSGGREFVLNGDGLRANLDLLEEVREESQIRAAAYKQKVSRYHDTKIRQREFRTGDLVLRKAAVSQPRRACKESL
ncbi:uncharacterized protein LOC143849580 [Tasmannia lanceolata]|uniref:uncharacterized protein LOC143849580 n=1 Tax=Tasmannia lanceolata TaxID=3420 RepID=UPI004062F31F